MTGRIVAFEILQCATSVTLEHSPNACGNKPYGHWAGSATKRQGYEAVDVGNRSVTTDVVYQAVCRHTAGGIEGPGRIQMRKQGLLERKFREPVRPIAAGPEIGLGLRRMMGFIGALSGSERSEITT